MALEAVVFSQDPLITSYTNFFKEYNLCNFGVGGGSSSWSYDFSNNCSSKFDDEDKPFVGMFDANTSTNYDYSNSNTSPSEINVQNDVNHWDQQQQHHEQQYVNVNVNSGYSSPEAGHHDCTNMDQYYLSGEAPPTLSPLAPPTTDSIGCRRKRRRKSCKNKEEVEHQRMTHIAVERNRRKQMNEYLTVIRNLMPPSYAQRGDQASIVGGAINYVKELEQLMQSLEGQKRSKHQHQHQHQHDHQDQPRQQQRQPSQESPTGNISVDDLSSPKTGGPALFADFFSFPQYSNRSANQPGNNSVCSNTAAGEIEVTMVDSHANVKILAKKQSKQLLALVAGFQGLRLSVLHLNVTTVDPMVLYSFSVKVEEGCQLNSVDDIAAATNHILRQIQEEAANVL